MASDADQAPASPVQHAPRAILLVWIALGLAGWLVIAALGLAVYLIVTALL